jgi:pilus assembly protein CpaB
VNLLVSPEQAETLSLASNDARIQLVLRNPLDNEEVKTQGRVLNSLFGAAPAPPTPASVRVRPASRPVAASPKVVVQAPPPPFVIEIYHGGKSGSKKSESKFKQEEKQGNQGHPEEN